MKSLILSLTLVSLGASSNLEDINIELGSGELGGHHYKSALTLSQLVKAPKWNAATETLPLTPEKAVALAQKRAEIDIGIESPAFDIPWPISGTALVRFEASDMWYYRIVLSSAHPGTGNAPCVTNFVTLDGNATVLKEVKDRDSASR